MKATIMRHARVRGWPAHDHGERAYIMDLGTVLEREFSTDCHFTQYDASAVRRRLTREAPERLGGVSMGAIVFDYDGPDHQASGEWRREARSKVLRLFVDHPGFFYETRGGARIVHTIDPFVIRNEKDAESWTRLYQVACAHLANRYGIEVDTGCGDWQRLFRAPRATREEGGRPENRPTMGDERAIGRFAIQASREDVRRAERVACKVFRRRQIRDVTPCAASGNGVFFYALQARGDIIRPHGAGTFVIRCPRESEHSIGYTGDGSTLLYLPAAGKNLGAIYCSHAAKSRHKFFRAKDWLRCFSDHELETARLAAGIARAA